MWRTMAKNGSPAKIWTPIFCYQDFGTNVTCSLFHVLKITPENAISSCVTWQNMTIFFLAGFLKKCIFNLFLMPLCLDHMLAGKQTYFNLLMKTKNTKLKKLELTLERAAFTKMS